MLQVIDSLIGNSDLFPVEEEELYRINKLNIK
jgi:hypothetical protein